MSLGGGHNNQAGMAGCTIRGGAAATGNGASSGLNVGDFGMAPAPCLAGQKTTVSGTVYDPAGNTQLYNAVVFVPDGTPPPFPHTVMCEKCTDFLQAKDVALSDSNGVFTLKDVPADNEVELVVQLGKWRSKPEIVQHPALPSQHR